MCDVKIMWHSLSRKGFEGDSLGCLCDVFFSNRRMTVALKSRRALAVANGFAQQVRLATHHRA